MKDKKDYIIVNGTSYKKETPQAIINILEDSRQDQIRLLFDFGDIKTGKSWGEDCDIRGVVGRSCGGTYNIPLLIKTTRSHGGGALLDHCIIKITDIKTKEVLYQHSKYKD